MRRYARAVAALRVSLAAVAARPHADVGSTNDSGRAYGLTEIVAIVNKSGRSVYVLNQENGHSIRVPAGATSGIKENVPWCTSQSDWEQRHNIIVQIDSAPTLPKKVYWVWQSNESWQDRIRSFDQPWWKPQATPIGGDSSVNGERVLEIRADGALYLRRP